MSTRRPRPRLSIEELQRKHWLRALGIARILFEEDGYHTAYLNEIEAFLHQHPVPAPDAPQALDEDIKTRVARLAERMASGTLWCHNPQDPRWGTDEDLGQVYEEVRHLVTNDPQAAAALFAAYAPKHGPEALPPPATATSGDASAPAQPSAPDASPYRIEHYSYSRFWAVYECQELVAVTVYRKGAREITARLEARDRTIADLKRQRAERPTLG